MYDMAITVVTHAPMKRRSVVSHLLSAATLLLATVVWAFPTFCSSLKNYNIVSKLSRRNSNNFRRRYRKFAEEQAIVTKKISLPSSLSPCEIPNQDDKDFPCTSLFPKERPILAIITETNACDTEEKMNYTYTTIEKAVSTGKVDLVSVRLTLPPRHDKNGHENNFCHQILERACRLTKRLVELSIEQKRLFLSEEHENTITSQQLHSCSFVVVCSSDLVSVAVNARAHGVHIKEHHLDQFPDIIRRFDYPVVIGTSTHSVESALRSYCGNNFSNDCVETYDEDECTASEIIKRPTLHYFFVGTCYMTASHPEKLQSQLEGPELPGKVKRALLETIESKQERTMVTTGDRREDHRLRLPRIIAIGGIDESNCHEPVALGADGVAVIRAVLQADHPTERVEEMQSKMMDLFAERQLD